MKTTIIFIMTLALASNILAMEEKHLSSHELSPELSEYLLSLFEPKTLDLKTFRAGVKAFTLMANLSLAERLKSYGSKYSGLHYQNDLARLWNAENQEQFRGDQLNMICPKEWDYGLENGYFILTYKGSDPSSALDKLLQGPTVIDCGMFCQLSIWFGIRHVLGNDAFNELYGQAPIYITQLLYQPIKDPSKPYLGNPLYPFLEAVAPGEDMAQEIYIEHVKNHALYQLKHPGGNAGGQNCIIMQNKFTIFDPTLKTSSELTKADVKNLLIQALNAPQNDDDIARISLYEQKSPEDINPRLGLSYADLIQKYLALSQLTLSKACLISEGPRLKFNFSTFQAWVQKNYAPLSDNDLKIPDELTSLNGPSMRVKSVFDIAKLSDADKLDLLSKYTGKPSVGIIVGHMSYNEEMAFLAEAEFVPSFIRGIFDDMTQSLMLNNTLGATYSNLTPAQKKYTKRFTVNKTKMLSFGRYHTDIQTAEYWYNGIWSRAFDRTESKTIAIELIDYEHWSGKEIIEEESLKQLLRVINYAHDHGGKKVIVINKTKFDNEELLAKIKEDIQPREKERTIARINSLFFF